MAFATYSSLKDRTVFITGGASGIGAAFVQAFHDQGSKVAFVDLDEAAGQALAGTLGASAWFRHCDVTEADALQAAIRDAAAALGPVTVLINNVANDTRQAAAEVTPEAWRKGLAVNLDPTFIAATTVYPMMRDAGGGSIVNLSSINALLGPGELPTYSAAKGAINSLSKSLARAWGPDRIRVNALSPGWVVTPRQLELWLTPEAEAEWSKLVALKDRIMPEDIARAALFLASDDSRMMTGQNMVVDAGRT
ncbi:SDR family oxidoreductase [Phenylobacterium sp.]|jgi:NAD(P)-dependent dehydrogenase (short-subunit alcohol dehydrogenase family)|uniref:SDR family NAD(P)-dependent oxidoreductase n=1 Tax=Phenylobacterium sp. TaxID=1871053 RepID=UPI002E32836E|nr:SDR family oxidoreductase [Phenylobacterium sp.]HEX4712139.1 SDR family oxidoreductase [Phenylobacterium sp.]